MKNIFVPLSAENENTQAKFALCGEWDSIVCGREENNWRENELREELLEDAH